MASDQALLSALQSFDLKDQAFALLAEIVKSAFWGVCFAVA